MVLENKDWQWGIVQSKHTMAWMVSDLGDSLKDLLLLRSAGVSLGKNSNNIQTKGSVRLQQIYKFWEMFSPESSIPWPSWHLLTSLDHMGVSMVMEVPQKWMVYNGKFPSKWMTRGTPISGNHRIWICRGAKEMAGAAALGRFWRHLCGPGSIGGIFWWRRRGLGVMPQLTGSFLQVSESQKLPDHFLMVDSCISSTAEYFIYNCLSMSLWVRI